MIPAARHARIRAPTAGLCSGAPARTAPAQISPGPSTEGLLPRRVRQASLAPQLRAPVEEEADTVPSRSPEQVRSLMSALQRGTARGRLAAAGGNPDSPIPAQRQPAEGGPDETGAENVVNGPGFAEAATVIFPVVQNRAGPEGSDAPGRHATAEPREIIETVEINPDPDRAADRNTSARPDKDA